jgi:basic membrane protein A
MKRKLSVLITAVAALAVAAVIVGGVSAAPARHAAAKPKIAVLLSTGLKDTGYGRAAYSGILQLQKQFGIKIDTTDLIKPADFATAGETYASRGYDIVVYDGVEFQDAAKQVAAKFPKTNFIVVNGFLGIPPNLSAGTFVWQQIGFLAGLAAGLATKSNIVGGVGGVQIPPIVSLYDGYTQGVKYVNPRAKVIISWSGTFTDPAKAKTTAEAQISRGVDVIYAISDSANTGIYQAVKEKNIKAIGYGTDENSFAPKNVITTTLVGYGKVVHDLVTLAIKHQIKPQVYVFSFKTKTAGLAPFRGLVPPAVSAKILRLAKQAEAGKIPIKTK